MGKRFPFDGIFARNITNRAQNCSWTLLEIKTSQFFFFPFGFIYLIYTCCKSYFTLSPTLNPTKVNCVQWPVLCVHWYLTYRVSRENRVGDCSRIRIKLPSFVEAKSRFRRNRVWKLSKYILDRVHQEIK